VPSISGSSRDSPRGWLGTTAARVSSPMSVTASGEGTGVLVELFQELPNKFD